MNHASNDLPGFRPGMGAQQRSYTYPYAYSNKALTEPFVYPSDYASTSTSAWHQQAQIDSPDLSRCAHNNTNHPPTRHQPHLPPADPDTDYIDNGALYTRHLQHHLAPVPGEEHDGGSGEDGPLSPLSLALYTDWPHHDRGRLSALDLGFAGSKKARGGHEDVGAGRMGMAAAIAMSMPIPLSMSMSMSMHSDDEETSPEQRPYPPLLDIPRDPDFEKWSSPESVDTDLDVDDESVLSLSLSVSSSVSSSISSFSPPCCCGEELHGCFDYDDEEEEEREQEEAIGLLRSIQKEEDEDQGDHHQHHHNQEGCFFSLVSSTLPLPPLSPLPLTTPRPTPDSDDEIYHPLDAYPSHLYNTNNNNINSTHPATLPEAPYEPPPPPPPLLPPPPSPQSQSLCTPEAAATLEHQQGQGQEGALQKKEQEHLEPPLELGLGLEAPSPLILPSPLPSLDLGFDGDEDELPLQLSSSFSSFLPPPPPSPPSLSRSRSPQQPPPPPLLLEQLDAQSSCLPLALPSPAASSPSLSPSSSSSPLSPLDATSTSFSTSASAFPAFHNSDSDSSYNDNHAHAHAHAIPGAVGHPLTFNAFNDFNGFNAYDDPTYAYDFEKVPPSTPSRRRSKDLPLLDDEQPGGGFPDPDRNGNPDSFGLGPFMEGSSPFTSTSTSIPTSLDDSIPASVPTSDSHLHPHPQSQTQPHTQPPTQRTYFLSLPGSDTDDELIPRDLGPKNYVPDPTIVVPSTSALGGRGARSLLIWEPMGMGLDANDGLGLGLNSGSALGLMPDGGDEELDAADSEVVKSLQGEGKRVYEMRQRAGRAGSGLWDGWEGGEGGREREREREKEKERFRELSALLRLKLGLDGKEKGEQKEESDGDATTTTTTTAPSALVASTAQTTTALPRRSASFPTPATRSGSSLHQPHQSQSQPHHQQQQQPQSQPRRSSTKPRITSMAQLVANMVFHRQQHPRALGRSALSPSSGSGLAGAGHGHGLTTPRSPLRQMSLPGDMRVGGENEDEEEEEEERETGMGLQTLLDSPMFLCASPLSFSEELENGAGAEEGRR